MEKMRVTTDEISGIKQQHVKDNLLYTPIEAARLLKISVRTVYNLIYQGEIEAINHSGMTTKGTRITAQSIEKYIQKNKIIP